MSSPEIPLQFLVNQAQAWIAEQRDLHRPEAARIPGNQRAQLVPWFSETTLDQAQIRRVPLIENPSFYRELGYMPLDFSTMAGITFGDTILVSSNLVPDPTPVGLVFHELVHTVQYDVLGIPGFAERYVLGWAENGFDYLKIPLEVQAYQLQGLFERDALGDTDVERLIRDTWSIP